MNWLNLNDRETKIWELRIKAILRLSSDFHNQFTPFTLCQEIIQKLSDITPPRADQKWLIIANLEFVFVLVSYFQHKGWSTKNIYFATPCEHKKKFASFWLPIENIQVYSYNNLNLDLFNMKFNYVVGNPPFNTPKKESTDKTAALFVPFVEQALLLADTVGLVLPAVWVNASKRKITKTLVKSGLRKVYDCSDYGLEITQEACYVLIERGYKGQCEIRNRRKQTFNVTLNGTVPLRDNPQTAAIWEKIRSNTKHNVGTIWSHPQRVCRGHLQMNNGHTPIVVIVGKKGTPPTLSVADVTSSWFPHFDKWKVVTNWNGGWGFNNPIGVMKIVGPGYATTTNVVSFGVNTEEEAKNLVTYLQTKFIQYIVGTLKVMQCNSQSVFNKVPLVDLTRSWTDRELYEHFNLTPDEINLIENTVK